MPPSPVILADGIDLPLVLIYGLAILIPLMAFQVVVESAVLSKVWRAEYRGLLRFVFRANIASLLAGIPVKILNAILYGFLLPRNDLFIYFKRYPLAVTLGTLLYFVVTVLVETRQAVRLKREYHLPIGTGRLWTGMVLANLATYSVLAPIHYHLTQPRQGGWEFTADTGWTSLPETRIWFTDPASGEFMTCRVNGAEHRLATPGEREASVEVGDRDECDEWTAWTLHGLSSHLLVWKASPEAPRESLNLAVNSGLMRLPDVQFVRVRFLEGCRKLVFESSQAIYLMDIETRRVGKITDGEGLAMPGSPESSDGG